MGHFIVDYLGTYFDEVKPQDFYRSIFPLGELEERGKQETGRYNAIAVEVLPEEKNNVNAYRHILNDDLGLLDKLLESNNFIIMSPISYAGWSRVSTNARFIYAIVFDLDGITGENHLRDLFFQIENGFLPKPTYTVFSGSGLHLYYQLEKPIACFSNITNQLVILKRELTKKIWNKYTTTLYDRPQIESLFQGFRLVGGITKSGERTKAFLTGDKITLEYLNNFVEDKYRVKEFKYKSKLTLEEAKRRYPEWYNNRIIEKKPKGTWTTKRDLFDWWVKKIYFGASVGHRYFCIMTLAIYAKKAGIQRDELEKIAFDLVNVFDKLTLDKTNRFTREDVIDALEMYNDNYKTFPIDSIVNLTNIPIEKNKRNYMPQKEHLESARERKKQKKELGRMNKEGRPSKEREIIEWRNRYPNKSKEECMEELSISKSTVYKYWEIAAPKT